MGRFDANIATLDTGKYVNVVSSLQVFDRSNRNTITDIDLKSDNNASVISNVKVDFGEPDREKYSDIIKDEVKMDFITENLNELMNQWNADLKFVIHRDTGNVIVRFVNSENNKVVKEFPPEEYLDMIANIRKYILGYMVDKKI